MQRLKHLFQTAIELVKWVRLLPYSLAMAGRRKRRRAILEEDEAERLDRIRNPSKYLGK